MKIHDNAIEYLTNLLKSDSTSKKYLRLKKDGCGWHGRYKIVLDERKNDDLLYTDKGFEIIVSSSMSSVATTALIECRKTINGYIISVR